MAEHTTHLRWPLSEFLDESLALIDLVAALYRAELEADVRGVDLVRTPAGLVPWLLAINIYGPEGASVDVTASAPIREPA